MSNTKASRTRTVTLTIGSIAAGALLATGVTGLAMADDTATPSPSTSGQSGTLAPQSGTLAPLSSDSAAGSTGMRDGGRHGGQHGAMDGRHGGPMGEPLHGEMVVKAEDGTISTERMVSGTVTAVSATSITVKAEDGYVGTFAVNAETEVHTGLPQRGQAASTESIADVSVGDVARVHGPVAGGTATAADVHAMTAEEAAQVEQLHQQQG